MSNLEVQKKQEIAEQLNTQMNKIASENESKFKNDNLELKCPKCHIIFSIEDFENNEFSRAHYEQFVQQLREATIQKLEKECEARLSLKFDEKLKNRTDNLELQKNKEIAEQLSAKINEFNSEKELLTKQFNEQLNQTNMSNQELKAKIDNLELQKNKEIAEQLSAKMNEFNSEKELLLKTFNEQLNQTNMSNQELKAKIDNLELQKNKEIAEQLSAKINEFNSEKELLTKQFNEQLNQTNMSNQELKAKIDNLELQKNKEIAEQLSTKMNEFNSEKELLLQKFNEQLNQTNMSNQELKAKIDNLEIQKKQEIAEQLSTKMNEFNSEKELLLKQFNEQLNQTNMSNQELKAKIDNLELQKNKEIAEQISTKMNEFNSEKELLLKTFNDELNKFKEEIHKLEMENQKNKLTNNKIQGDNLEQEIEEILSNTFFLDSISKITAVGKKADLLQKVRLEGGDEFIANITYEIKSTKEWNDNWEMKFLDDMRKTQARYGIITATAYSVKYGKKIFAISEKNPNIYFCSHENVALVAQIVRMFIVAEHKIKNHNKNKNDLEMKLETLVEWKKTKFSHFSSKIKNSIDGLEKVKTTINNQIQPLEDHIKTIKDNFIEKIEQGLNLLIE